MIRQATASDFPRIFELYKAGLEALGLKYKESLLKKNIAVCYQLAPCFLVVKNDNIVGMAGFKLVTTSHDGVASLADYMFYIMPEHRNIKTLGALLDKIKDFAVTHNFPVRVDFQTNVSIEARERLLTRFGFKVSSISGVYNGR